jgi:hypothetical protein
MFQKFVPDSWLIKADREIRSTQTCIFLPNRFTNAHIRTNCEQKPA